MSDNQSINISDSVDQLEFESGTVVDVIKPRQQRWQEEAAFFDDVASRSNPGSLIIDPSAIQRYSSPVLRKRFNKEFRFLLMGPLEGKRILDVGCGEGTNSVMLAMMGAIVTGIDISPKSIEVARHRAKLNNVLHKVEFICSPVETAALSDKYFDIIWGDGILHHVLDELETIMQHVRRSLKPDGLFLFAEPVNLFKPLRHLRNMVPVKTDATPGERPLLSQELDIVARNTGEFHRQYYGLFGRLDRFILTSFNYEKSSPFRRAIVNCIDLVDLALLSVPIFQPLASVCVMYGKPKH